MEERQVRKLKILLLVSSLVCFVLLVASALQENVTSPWKKHQKAYARLLAEEATDDDDADSGVFPVRLRQNYLETLGRIDRCVTCHTGIDNQGASEYPQPLTAHPGDLLTHHSPDKFGCTICHQGQGRATVLPDAHGEVAHWGRPLLRGQLAYTSCGGCHYENDLYGGQADLYGQFISVEQVSVGELASHVPGAETIARGKQLVIQQGCLGCHTYRGRGGNLGPDITHVGDKTVHDFDFSHVHGDHSVLNWMYSHFKSPEAVVPGTMMPDMALSDADAYDLAAYMVSLKRKTAPAEYTPLPRPVDRTPADGHTLYELYCSSCHGLDGVGAVARDAETFGAIDRPRELITPSLRNDDTLAVASDDYLRHIIRHGRTGTGMRGWSDEVGGLSEGEIDRLVSHIRSWQSADPPTDSISADRGNPTFGRALFSSRCVGCHGTQGEGGVGVSLRSPSFLAVASDEFLRDAILDGRTNTAMPSWKQLSADEVSDLIAYIRQWQPERSSREVVLQRLTTDPDGSSQSKQIGQILYRANCAGCHALDGAGSLGPSLNTDEFLSLIDDDYLYSAIARGRPGTAMPAWKHLSDDDLVDLIHYVRDFNDNGHRTLDPYMAHGDWDRGEILFKGICAGCHGREAEGASGPQLANPVFLETVSDEILREWIRYGKLGTAMLGFLRGEQGVVEMTESQIDDVVTYLRHNQYEPRTVTARPGMGIVPYGAQIFAGVCAGCHGTQGEGLVGSALSNPEFLRSASDGYLAATIVLGRDETPMLPMGRGLNGAVELDEEDVANVVAFLRHWEHDPPTLAEAPRYVVGADLHDGRDLWVGYCAGCHGTEGDDGWAPALNNPDFLAAATDGFLQATIARGRMGTAMRPFSKGSGGLAPLTSEQIDNIVGYIRQWAVVAEEAKP